MKKPNNRGPVSSEVGKGGFLLSLPAQAGTGRTSLFPEEKPTKTTLYAHQHHQVHGEICNSQEA
eukprot:CAMPEP_0178448308 /NCGR_PEP_ID=MMETSP0689_2-20121128/41912_1 /TAXON_ID=160604 /ORGANISM="Amphidinium massartii, Strain CS-259" /LENGTH=63 /DNA_ID=CAMNT_0020073479 /DNA_START=57 /DNA_END=246 /DNA_ORIENTATION=-